MHQAVISIEWSIGYRVFRVHEFVLRHFFFVFAFSTEREWDSHPKTIDVRRILKFCILHENRCASRKRCRPSKNWNIVANFMYAFCGAIFRVRYDQFNCLCSVCVTRYCCSAIFCNQKIVLLCAAVTAREKNAKFRLQILVVPTNWARSVQYRAVLIWIFVVFHGNFSFFTSQIVWLIECRGN